MTAEVRDASEYMGRDGPRMPGSQIPVVFGNVCGGVRVQVQVKVSDKD